MNTIRFPGASLEELRSALLANAPNEAAAMLIAEHVDMGEEAIFLVQEVMVVPPASMRADPLSVTVNPSFIAGVMKKARNATACVFFVHTHPAFDDAWFSHQDDVGERLQMSTLFQRVPAGPHGAIVLTATKCAARVYRDAESAPTEARVVEVGATLRFATTVDGAGDEPSADRTVRALGAEAQRILGTLRVGIVGLGGMGSLVAQQLAHLGVNRFVLIDPEPVEETNLNRLVGATPLSCGLAKVDVARRMIESIRPSANVQAIQGDVRFAADASHLIGLDLVMACTDSHGSRAILNQLAHQYYIAVVDTGVRIDARDGRITSVAGRTQLLAQGVPCLICDGLLDPEQVRRDLLSDDERARDPYIVGHHEPQPAVISINGVVASLAITMVLAIACGFPLPARHQVYMADRGVVRAVSGTIAPTCYVCSLNGARGRGGRWAMPWRKT